MNKRPTCAVWVAGTGERCTKPAIYYVEDTDCLIAVCGLCARRYIATVLHPLRLKDWFLK